MTPRGHVAAQRLVGITVAAVTVGCRALGPTNEEPALIIVPGNTARITAPDTVSVGGAFQVLVETFGGGCVRDVGHAAEKVTGSVVEIRPYNQTLNVSGRLLCPADFLVLVHSVTVEIRRNGPAVIRVIAMRRDGAGRFFPAQVERTVVVR